MEKSVQITLIIVAGVIFLALIPVMMFYDRNPEVTVNAQGTSEISASPDLVTVYFDIQTRGDSAQEAKNNNSEISDDVITSLLKLGFERKDIQTQNYNIYPDYSWNSGQQRGYIASNSLKVEMSTSDSGRIGDVIDAGVDNGASLSYINFELSLEKQNEYKAQALSQATQDARIKAESIALGLGKTLGKVVSVSTSNFDYSPWNLYSSRGAGIMEDAAEAKAATTSIQPSDKDITANVNVVFEIR